MPILELGHHSRGSRRFLSSDSAEFCKILQNLQDSAGFCRVLQNAKITQNRGFCRNRRGCAVDGPAGIFCRSIFQDRNFQAVWSAIGLLQKYIGFDRIIAYVISAEFLQKPYGFCWFLQNEPLGGCMTHRNITIHKNLKNIAG